MDDPTLCLLDANVHRCPHSTGLKNHIANRVNPSQRYIRFDAQIKSCVGRDVSPQLAPHRRYPRGSCAGRNQGSFLEPIVFFSIRDLQDVLASLWVTRYALAPFPLPTSLPPSIERQRDDPLGDLAAVAISKLGEWFSLPPEWRTKDIKIRDSSTVLRRVSITTCRCSKTLNVHQSTKEVYFLGKSSW